MDDGNPEWTADEQQNLKIAYTFASFWAGSTEGMQARADQMWTDQGVEKTALNDSFPLVTGKAFDEQMTVWYSTLTHQRFGDAAKMPGFQKCIELWKAGQFWDISDKTYPYFVTEDGTQKQADYEWKFIYQADIAGAKRAEPNWLDQVKAKLPDWNKKINERYVLAETTLRDGLKQFYGFTDDDFKAKK
jgi:hypothetical protein